MKVLERFGKVYGAELSAKEKKALTIEIQKELKEMTHKFETEVDAIFLWWLHTCPKTKFGHQRLKEFYQDFSGAMDELRERLGMKHGEEVWYCTHLLKEYGIDLEAWDKEVDENNEKKGDKND